MFDRDTQIELMKNVEERTAGYLKKWLENKEFRAALHRFDRDGHDDGRQQAKRSSCG